MKDETLQLDCGDNSCHYAKVKTGMRTNGGCRCFEQAGFHGSTIASAYAMLPEIVRLRGMVKTAYGYMLEHKNDAVVIEWLERADAVVKHEG